jgi:MFS family permease
MQNPPSPESGDSASSGTSATRQVLSPPSRRLPESAQASLSARPLMRNRDFLLLWGGQAVSVLGTSISTLALTLLALALTGSPAHAGLIAAVQLAPYLALSLPAGALVDRWDRKRLMIACDAIRWLAYGSVPAAFLADHLQVAQLYLVALISGTAFVFFDVAQLAALPQVVAEAQLAQANALNDAAISVATLIGPGLSGTLIGLAQTPVAGGALAYGLDSLSFLVSVLSLSRMRVAFQERGRARADQAEMAASDDARVPSSTEIRMHQEIRAGLRFSWSQRPIRLLAALVLAIGLLASPADLALIVLARNQLHADARLIGVIFSVGSGGGIIGAALAPSIQRGFRLGAIVAATTGCEGLACAVIALAHAPWMLMVGMAGITAAIPIFGAVQVSFRLAATPDELQGRVSSVFGLLFFGVQPLGTAAGGLLLPVVGPRIELWVTALGLLATAALVTRTSLWQAR